jgi:hypothetical protein
MKKAIPFILAIIALILIAVGISKTFAFDIVSSPTYQQGGTPP